MVSFLRRRAAVSPDPAQAAVNGDAAPEPRLFAFATAQTREFVASSSPRVYLYGSAEGYANFGDIAQLKAAIRFHRDRGAEVVVFFAVEAVISTAHLDELIGGYGAQHLVFITSQELDASAVGLEPVSSFATGGAVHVYGGGYLNRFWGQSHIFKLRTLVATLGIQSLVVSGVQLDESVVEGLREIAAVCPPALFGVRDRISIDVAKQIVDESVVRFSFDDAFDMITGWARAAGQAAAQDSGAPAFGLHLNSTSEYTAGSAQLDRTRAILEAVERSHPGLELVAIHAYDDIRAIVTDTLSSILMFEATFPFERFEVVRTARMVLADDGSALSPTIQRLAGLEFGIVSSYHTALLLHTLGVPAYLLTLNDYYSQKAALFRQPEDIETFLASPQDYVRDFSPEAAERDAWLAELAEVTADWAELPVTAAAAEFPVVVGDEVWRFPGRGR